MRYKEAMTEEGVIAWLNEEFGEKKTKRGERIAWLVKCNGGFIVNSWGDVATDPANPFPVGLDQEDALELIEWKSFVDGMCDGSGLNVYTMFQPFFNEFVDRKITEHKNKPEPPEPNQSPEK